MSNEITVRITCSLQEMYNILQNKGFKITDKYNLEDTYYIKEDIDIKKQPIKEIFNKYIPVSYTHLDVYKRQILALMCKKENLLE